MEPINLIHSNCNGRKEMKIKMCRRLELNILSWSECEIMMTHNRSSYQANQDMRSVHVDKFFFHQNSIQLLVFLKFFQWYSCLLNERVYMLFLASFSILHALIRSYLHSYQFLAYFPMIQDYKIYFSSISFNKTSRKHHF